MTFDVTFPRVDQLLRNHDPHFPRKGVRKFLNQVVVPLGMPALDVDEPLYDVLDKMEQFLRLHYLPANFKGDDYDY